MAYQVVLSPEANEFYQTLDAKSQRIVKRNLRELEDDPYPRPDAGRGDREKIVYQGYEGYRMHIGRTYTAFYRIDAEGCVVQVLILESIDDAHKRYGH